MDEAVSGAAGAAGAAGAVVARATPLAGGGLRATKVALFRAAEAGGVGERQFLFSEFLRGIAEDATVRTALAGALHATSYPSFFWECPPVSRETLDRPFEFVIVDAPSLSHVVAEPQVFREHFDAAAAGCADVCAFPNLGGDALLVVPRPVRGLEYAHLGQFSHTAPLEQVHALWALVGREMTTRLAQLPSPATKIWLSTAGGGVYWLHVRLDSRPKYYTWAPYKI